MLLALAALTLLQAASAPAPEAKPAHQHGAPVAALDGSVKVSVAGRAPVTFTAAELKALPRVKAVLATHGKRVGYEGPTLVSVLAKAGAVTGDRLMSRYIRQVAVIRAADGYVGVLTVTEMDPVYRASPVILADTVEGKPLDAKEGPWRIVVDGDLRAGRSVRQVVAIEVKSVD